MGRLPSGVRKYNIEQLAENQKEMLRRISAGEKPINIAKDMGYSPVTLSYVRHSPLGERYLAGLEQESNEKIAKVKAELVDLLPLCKNAIEQALEPGIDMQLRTKVAMDLLDRCGVSKPKQVTADIRSVTLTSEDLKTLKVEAVRLCMEG